VKAHVEAGDFIWPRLSIAEVATSGTNNSRDKRA